MKLRIKYSGTEKFTISVDESDTFEVLKKKVIEFVCATYNDSVTEVDLSFNGIDVIEQGNDVLVKDTGIVSGDLLSIIRKSSCGQTTSVIQSAGMKSEMKAIPVRKSEGLSNTESVPQPCSSFFSDDLYRPVCSLLEYRSGRLPVIVLDAFSQYKPSSPNHVINLLVHLTMLETGFHLDGPESSLPPSWKDLVSTIRYVKPEFSNFLCSIVIVTMGEVKQVMVSFVGQESEIMVQFNTKEYFTGPEMFPANIKKMPQFVFTLRNQLLYPLQVAAHQTLGVPAPWHLAGLPQEILLIISATVPVRDILNIAETCKTLNSSIQDNKLWFNLYKRDFRKSYKSTESLSSSDWKVKYKEAFSIARKQSDFAEIASDTTPNPIPHPLYPSPLYPSPLYPDPFCPYVPDPLNPIPYFPPNAPINPYGDPDSVYFIGDIPPPRGPLPRMPNQPSYPPFGRQPRGPRFTYF